jgi:uncharacterized protein (DUF58 family)
MSALFDEAFLRRLEALALLYRRAANSQMQGERRSSQRGQSVEFSDFRPYTRGDDFRRIDWNAYARLERLFIKLFVEEQDATLHLLVDNSQSMRWGQPGKLDLAVRLAGALGYIAMAGLDRVTALALGSNRRLSNLRGKRSALNLFNFLESNAVEPQNIVSPAPGRAAMALNQYAAQVKQPGPVIVLSDMMEDGWQTGLTSLAGRGYEISLIHILSPDELEPELAGDFKLIDSEDNREVEISADFETLTRYKQFLSDWQDGWRQFCAARGMHYVPLSSATPLEEALFALLPGGGVLR